MASEVVLADSYAAGTAFSFRRGSLKTVTRMGACGSISFTLILSDTSTPIQIGEEIYVRAGSDVIFGGTITGIKEVDFTMGATTYRKVDYKGVCFNKVPERMLAVEVYDNQAAGTIVGDLRTNYLNAEGITAGTIDTGETIEKAVFNYRTVSAALNDIAELTGLQWWIKPDKSLQFRDRESLSAPLSITPTSRPYRSISIEETQREYRNVQYVRAGNDLTSSLTEDFTGDGSRKTFNVSFPVGEAPTITVNTVSKTVGINGVDEGKQFYYNLGRTEITQASSETVLTSSDDLEVTYKGQIPIIAEIRDPAEIERRKAVEGGTGVYERVVDDQNINKQDLAEDKGAGLIRRFGFIPKIITFVFDQEAIDTAGSPLETGQLMSIDLPEHNLIGDYLIEQISASVLQDNTMRYTVRLLDGEAVGTWIEFFKKLAESGRRFVIRENEVLVILRSMSDALILSESLVSVTETSGAYTFGATTLFDFADFGT